MLGTTGRLLQATVCTDLSSGREFVNSAAAGCSTGNFCAPSEGLLAFARFALAVGLNRTPIESRKFILRTNWTAAATAERAVSATDTTYKKSPRASARLLRSFSRPRAIQADGRRGSVSRSTLRERRRSDRVPESAVRILSRRAQHQPISGAPRRRGAQPKLRFRRRGTSVGTNAERSLFDGHSHLQRHQRVQQG